MSDRYIKRLRTIKAPTASLATSTAGIGVRRRRCDLRGDHGHRRRLVMDAVPDPLLEFLEE